MQNVVHVLGIRQKARTMKWMVLLVVGGCSLAPLTTKAKIRQEGAARLKVCLNSFKSEEQCIKEAKQWCLAQGMERDCALDDFWGQPRKAMKSKEQIDDK